MIKIIYKKVKSLLSFVLVTIAMLIVRFLLFLAKIIYKNNENVYEEYCEFVRAILDDIPDAKYKAYCYDLTNVL